MPSVEYDLIYLQDGLADMQSYLLSKELYWPIDASPPPREPPFPRLTLEGLLLAQTRLRGQTLSTQQQVEYDQLSRTLDDLRSNWRVAWERKAVQGFRARLNQWRNFLEDYRENPSGNMDRYAYEVRLRVMLQLLIPEKGQINSAEESQLRSLDNLLKARFRPGKFIWDPALEGSFPAGVYWYLYGSLT